METVGVVVGPWAVGGIRADQDNVVWAGNGGLIVTPVKYPRRTHSHPPVVKDEEQREKTEETNEETQEEEKVTDEDQKVIEEEDSRTSYFSTFSPLVSLDRVELSPSGSVVIVGGCIAGGMGVLIWRDWPLIQDSPGHTLMTGHKIYHLEFSSRGDYLGVLSIPESKRIEADADLEYPEMVLTIWRWPVQENAEESDVEAEDADGHNTEDFSDEELVTRRSINCPRKLLVTTMPQLKPEQVNRMSLARGLPDGVIAAMIAAEDELSVWQVIDGPLGLRIQSSTIGFGLHEPDQVLSMYCLAMDAVRTILESI
ncbi:hypothetical protein SK128_023522 [Halocaridina rubra]|uniref:Uncharacterized protein n=1 Tax=Halocaridina rubra TaxID=373956 RepID=A0AAN8X8H5_HALRR